MLVFSKFLSNTFIILSLFSSLPVFFNFLPLYKIYYLLDKKLFCSLLTFIYINIYV